MMSQRKFGLLGAMLAVVCVVSPRPASAGVMLTGLINFSTDAAGAASGGSIWNTRGGDNFFNLYVTQPNSGINGPFLNTGDGAGAGINLSLAEGKNEFFLFGEPGADVGRFGLNLFFGGNNSNPGISVFAASDQPPSPPFPNFSPNNSASTLALDSTVVPGAGTLSFTSGSSTVTLTDYRWSVPSVQNLDRVQAFAIGANGANDFVGSFTLQVRSVPEPASVVLLGTGVLALLGYGSRRRKASEA